MAPHASLSPMEGPALRLARLLESGDEAFVRDAYRLLLGREPDPRGFHEYLEQLAAGASRMRLLAAMAQSDEARTRGASDRSISELVVAYARRRDAVPASLDALLDLADAEFVIGAYRTVLGRDADPAGIAYYSQRLRSGDPKEDILAILRRSEEGRQCEAAWRQRSAPQLAMLVEVDAAVKAQSWARLPVIGALIAAVFGLESYTASGRRLRRIENLVARSATVLGVGVIDAGIEVGAAPDAARVSSAPERDPSVNVSPGNSLGDRLLTLPRVLGPGDPRAQA
jgi:hypothetical protein